MSNQTTKLGDRSLKDRLVDLHKQATEEQSHYYTGNLIKETIDRIDSAKDVLDRIILTIEENERQGVHTSDDWIIVQARRAIKLLEE